MTLAVLMGFGLWKAQFVQRREAAFWKHYDAGQRMLAAVHMDWPALVRAALDDGADPNAFDNDNDHFTALGAAFRNENPIEIAELLLSRGADPNADWNAGGFPLICEQLELDKLSEVDFMLRHGGNPNSINTAGEPMIVAAARRNSLPMLRLLLDAGANVNGRDKKGRGALYTLIDGAEPDLDAIKLLLSRHAEVNLPDDSDQTPLQRAVFHSELELVQMLVEHGADVRTTDVDGITPLHLAAYRDDIELVRMLVEHGANANAKNAEELTPRQLTVRPDVLDALTAGSKR